MPPRRGGICGRLAEDLPLGYLQGGEQKNHGTCVYTARGGDADGTFKEKHVDRRQGDRNPEFNGL